VAYALDEALLDLTDAVADRMHAVYNLSARPTDADAHSTSTSSTTTASTTPTTITTSVNASAVDDDEYDALRLVLARDIAQDVRTLLLVLVSVVNACVCVCVCVCVCHARYNDASTRSLRSPALSASRATASSPRLRAQ
jgi:hypothetical protein